MEKHLYNLNIERAVLSTIIFEPVQYEEIAAQLKPEDFYHPFHQHIFLAMEDLFRSDQPIDEEFLREKLTQKNQFDEVAFLDVLSANPLSNTSAYIKEIKEASRIEKIKNVVLQTLENINKTNTLNSSKLLSYLENSLENIQKNNTFLEVTDLETLIKNELKPIIVYSTGLDFLDEILGGGFEMGQLITVTGEQEAGKTQIVNQILFNVAKGFKCLYFSLEFNKRQLVEYTKRKIRNSDKKYNLKNIQVVTDDLVSGHINEIVSIIKQSFKQHSTKFVAIDSQMMLFEDDENLQTNEEKTTSIFRKLHSLSKKLDICILLIAQSSKEDLKSKKVEIFGSKKATHFARIMIHINRPKIDENIESFSERELIVSKNKQNGKSAKIRVFFDREKLEFVNSNKKHDNKKNSVFDLIQ